jgi:hypothetical protein
MTQRTRSLISGRMLDAAARRVPARRPRDGQLRLPRRPPGNDAVDAAVRPEHRDDELHAGVVPPIV